MADPVAQTHKVTIDKLGGATPQDPLDVSFPQSQFAQPWTGSKFKAAREGLARQLADFEGSLRVLL